MFFLRPFGAIMGILGILFIVLGWKNEDPNSFYADGVGVGIGIGLIVLGVILFAIEQMFFAD